MRFAFFFLAEYANMIVVAGVATTCFWAAGHRSCRRAGRRQLIPGPVMFIAKVLFVIFLQMWLRWSLRACAWTS